MELSEDKGKKDGTRKEYGAAKTKLETKGTNPSSVIDSSGKGGGWGCREDAAMMRQEKPGTRFLKGEPTSRWLLKAAHLSHR